MEDSCKVFIKKEFNSSSPSHFGQVLPSLSPCEVQRERRHIRAEIIRCKRAGVSCDEDILVKKRRLDEMSTVSSQSVSSCAQFEMDSNKIRQLRNRESAERSRLKKDLLVESLTFQVLQCVLQISDLKEEQMYLKNQQMGCPSSPYSTADDSSSVTSAITTCDEAESDSDCDDAASGYSSLTPSTASPHFDFSTKLHLVPTPCSPTDECFSTSSRSYFSEDELLDDCADLIDTWMLEGM